jgi:dimethylsulfone monooxygenase
MLKQQERNAGALEFGIWLPVYGGWLRTRDRSEGPDVVSCLAIAQQAEALGFDFLYASENLLNCVHGPRTAVIDAWSLISALAATTTRIGLCGAIKPGFRSPLLVARMVDTLSQIARRRLGINIVCGWWQDEFELANVPWLDHSGRYDRADAFLRALHRIFDPDMERSTSPDFLSNHAFRTSDAERDEHRTFGFATDMPPEVWVSGHSDRATRLTGEWGDCLFLNGTPDNELSRHIAEARQMAMRWGRDITIALNAFVIATESSQQARERRERVVRSRNDETIAFFRSVMEASGAAAWADLTDEQMVDSNSGFDAGLIGSFGEVRERLHHLAAVGVDKIVCQFDDPMRDVGPFMQHVIRPSRQTAAV